LAIHILAGEPVESVIVNVATAMFVSATPGLPAIVGTGKRLIPFARSRRSSSLSIDLGWWIFGRARRARVAGMRRMDDHPDKIEQIF
jgi:hypothetical protein